MNNIAANDNDEPYCIGRVYYGPFPWNFTWANTALLDEPGYAPSWGSCACRLRKNELAENSQ
jgi:hypothetical protein